MTVVETLLAVTGTLVIAVMAAPLTRSGETDRAAAAATRHLAAVLQRQRVDAIAHGASAALRFRASPAGVRFAAFYDGNGNGVRATDIDKGIDPQVSPWESLADHFPGVTVAIAPDVTDIDSGGLLAGGPVKIGGSDLLSFSPVGTASSGTVYVKGAQDQQFAVRVLGVTGRVRLLRFDRPTRQWVGP